MKAVNALPTEERVLKMNKHQWLWYYYNIVQDKKEEFKRQDDLVEYITSFINPELARTVREQRGDTSDQDFNEVVNDSFEEELKSMLQGEELTELPSSSGYNSYLSEEEFVKKAKMYEEIARTDPNNPLVKMLPRNKRLNEGYTDNQDILIATKTPKK